MAEYSTEVQQELLTSVRRSLRISREGIFDEEIADLIRAARSDLLLGGILPAKVYDTDDPLIKRAIVTYAKAEFGLDNPDSEKYRAAYQTLRTHLMLSGEYTVAEGVAGNVLS